MTLFMIIGISPFLQAKDSLSQLSWDAPANPKKIEQLQAPAELKVLWWNTACGNINAKLVKEQKQPDSLYTNIEVIASQAHSPDILILGEHCPGLIPKRTQTLLKKIYPNNFNLEHSNPFGKIRNGIWIFSKWKMQKIRQMSLVTEDTTERNNKTARTYLLFKISHKKNDFYLSPVHFYNPWSEYSVYQLPFAAVGSDNVNYRQIEEYLKLLQEDVEITKDPKSPVLVIGDFNSAKDFYGLTMSGVSLFQAQLFDLGTSEVTFPTPSAIALGNSFPEVIIDQTFASFSFGSTVTLPLKGSDHFPILFSF